MFGGESFCHISILQLNMMTSRDSDRVSVDGDVKYMEAMFTLIFIYSSSFWITRIIIFFI